MRGGLGVAAMSYVAVDYLRHVSPEWHRRLQPALWTVLALAAISRVPFYRNWSKEAKSALPFVGSMLFMLATLLYEALSVRSATAVLGLDWHRETNPLPDTGQWILLSLNEVLPQPIVDILRARIIGLHHFLMLFMMLAFSVLFDCVEAPGLGLGARVPAYPHRWAQKYYVPYASDSDAISQLINSDVAYADNGNYLGDYRPDWGSMSFLIDFLRPTASEGPSWYSVLKKAGGGCNDLLYSGHMLVAVLTAMAWTEAYGGFSSALIWVLVLHSAQREIREHHHYSVDCIVAIYVGILLWKMTGFLWPVKDSSKARRLAKLEEIQSKMIKAAKDSNIDEVRELLEEVKLSGQEGEKNRSQSKAMWVFPCVTIFSAIVIVLLAFTWTSDG
ncbi:hypothetical protein MLD38_022475 [Melastoma candidum]|uniref:Uncharacterized protein n=1 Tax=Melastoma candidum TaxID=119954 RepID=A0ACB9QKD9_9MYRT|nr:hypothetical protein MLD38_022475 [Melastoma candidum]